MNHKNISINWANNTSPPAKRIKVKLRCDLLWNKFLQRFAQTVQRLLNIATVTCTDLN